MTRLDKVVIGLFVLLCIAFLVVVFAVSAEGATKDRCPGQPDILKKVEGANERAKKGWNAKKVEKNRSAIQRVRIQSRCVPSQSGRRYVNQRIDKHRKSFKKAKAKAAYLKKISPPGADYLRRLRYCESGNHGLYKANTGNGFYGAYQFDLQTWGSVGGSGYPHLAPPREQDIRAATLFRQRGSQPWPVCG